MVEKVNFVLSTFSEEQLPTVYTSVQNAGGEGALLKNAETSFPLLQSKTFIVKDVPRYFDLAYQTLPKGIRLKKIKQYPGFLIDFQNVKNLDDYLANRFGRSSRYKLRRSQKKLEDSFDISYKMFFGDMSLVEYEFIIEEFYRLLAIRSLEKGIMENVNLKTKDHYKNIVHQMILDKKASFYVIFDGKMPIDICLNFHLKDCVFQFIRTYDINYSKFNTGYIDLMKQIEWCLGNKIRFISFSKGDFYWKRRWCNTVYDYDYRIFYDSKSLKSLCEMRFFILKRGLRQLMRELGVIEKYHRFKEEYKKDASIFAPTTHYDLTIQDVNFDLKNLLLVNVTADEYTFLKKETCNFLFDFNEEKASAVNVYHSLNGDNSFTIVGIKNIRVLNY